MFGFQTVIVVVAILVIGWGLANSRGFRARRWWERGVHALNGDDWAKAEQAFRKCVRLVPIWTGARKMLGVALVRQQKLDEAEEQFRMASALEPRKPEGHLDLGFFLATQRPERQEEAVDAFAQALEFDPAVRDVLLTEARLDFLKQNPRFRSLLRSAAEPE
jgi:Flp pilus assembly protein TadD